MDSLPHPALCDQKTNFYFFSPCRVYRAALLGPDYVAELSLPSRPVVVPKPHISRAYLLTRVSTKSRRPVYNYLGSNS